MLFAFSLLPALIVLFVRTRVGESEAWERTQERIAATQIRPRQVFFDPAVLRRFAYLVLLMTAFYWLSHGTQDVYKTYMVSGLHFSTDVALLVTILFNVGAMIGGVLSGRARGRGLPAGSSRVSPVRTGRDSYRERRRLMHSAEHGPVGDRIADALAVNDVEAVARALASAQLYLPRAGSSGDDAGDPAPATSPARVTLPVMESAGVRYVPAYTSPQLMAEAAPELDEGISLTGAELADLWPGDDVSLAVNPGTEEGVSLSADTARSLRLYVEG